MPHQIPKDAGNVSACESFIQQLVMTKDSTQKNHFRGILAGTSKPNSRDSNTFHRRIQRKYPAQTMRASDLGAQDQGGDTQDSR